MALELREDEIYYRFGGVVDGQLAVSSWVYDGVEKLSCSSEDCDTPFRFYRFVEWESLSQKQTNAEKELTVIYIPSLKAVSRTMIKGADLLKELRECIELNEKSWDEAP